VRKIILATLTSGLLLGETHIVFAECQTVAQVRAANPNSYLSYHLVAGARCWYVGSPHHRDVPAAEKPKLQSAISSNDDKPDGALLNEKPIDFRNAYELDTVAPPAGHAPYGERISGTFNVIGVDASSIESNESKTERLDEIRAVIYGPQPAPPPATVAITAIASLKPRRRFSNGHRASRAR